MNLETLRKMSSEELAKYTKEAPVNREIEKELIESGFTRKFIAPSDTDEGDEIFVFFEKRNEHGGFDDQRRLVIDEDTEEFRQIQEQLGYNNPEMAEFLDVSLNTIEKWRGGERKMSKLARDGIRYRVQNLEA